MGTPSGQHQRGKQTSATRDALAPGPDLANHFQTTPGQLSPPLGLAQTTESRSLPNMALHQHPMKENCSEPGDVAIESLTSKPSANHQPNLQKDHWSAEDKHWFARAAKPKHRKALIFRMATWEPSSRTPFPSDPPVPALSCFSGRCSVASHLYGSRHHTRNSCA